MTDKRIANQEATQDTSLDATAEEYITLSKLTYTTDVDPRTIKKRIDAFAALTDTKINSDKIPAKIGARMFNSLCKINGKSINTWAYRKNEPLILKSIADDLDNLTALVEIITCLRVWVETDADDAESAAEALRIMNENKHVQTIEKLAEIWSED